MTFFANEDDNLAGWAYQQTLLHQRWCVNGFDHLIQEQTIMGLTLKDNGGSFLPPPEGLHIARCYAIVDLGVQTNQTYGNSLPKVLLGWELMDTHMDDGKPFIQMQWYTASLSESSNLRALLEAWRGKRFTIEELTGFKLKNILGATCYLTTQHKLNPQTNKPRSKVISICRLPSNVTCPLPFNKPIYFDLDEYTEASYLAVPEGIRKKINLNGIVHAATLPPQPSHRPLQTPVSPAAPPPQQVEDLDEDIPF